MREDAELVELAIGGDGSAFSELYERYFDSVYDFLARMVRNRDEAADLAQDTFLRAMNSLSSLTKGGSFKSWLFTIARNQALNRLERSSRTQPLEQQGSGDEDDSFEMQVVDSNRFSNPEEAAEASAYAALVWEAASSLDPKQYAVLDLSIRRELKSEELAEVLGVSKNNAYVMVNRMKKGLQDAIGALVLLREGRRQCDELDRALEKLQVGEMTPDARKLIDRHARGCATCQEQRRKLSSPFGIFAGLGMLQPAEGARAGILDNLSTAYAQTYGAGMPPPPPPPPAPAGFLSGLPFGSGLRNWLAAGAALGVFAVAFLSVGYAVDTFAPGGNSNSGNGSASILAVPPTATPTPASASISTPTPAPASLSTAVPPTPTPLTTTIPPTPAPLTTTVPPTPAPLTTTVPPTPTPATIITAVPPTPTPCSITVTVSPTFLDFDTAATLMSVQLTAAGCHVPVDFTMVPDQSWINRGAGTIPANGRLSFSVTINRSLLPPGPNRGQIVVQSVVGQIPIDVEAFGVSTNPTPTQPPLRLVPTATPTTPPRGGGSFTQ